MVVVPSPAKILLRWIGLQRTFAGRWPSRGQEWPVQTCTRSAVLCDWRRQTPLAVRRDLWHRTGSSNSCRYHEYHQNSIRLPARGDCSVTCSPGAQVPRECCILPFWARGCDEEWHQIL